MRIEQYQKITIEGVALTILDFGLAYNKDNKLVYNVLGIREDRTIVKYVGVESGIMTGQIFYESIEVIHDGDILV